MKDEFLLQPNIYNTQGSKTLLGLLEEHWIEQVVPGQGTIYIISGFGNYNGGVRFYDMFANHIEKGGEIRAMFGAKASQRLTSRQVVDKMLDCGASITLLNRRRIMHAKLFGYKNGDHQSLIVTSGNFTGPGMTQNIEAAVGLSPKRVKEMGFDWENFYTAYTTQDWDLHTPTAPIEDGSAIARLLYNEEVYADAAIDVVDQDTMMMTLSHADTVRINAEPGTAASRGSQYFWLSKSAFEFFPALMIPNARGDKPTYSTIIKVTYKDLSDAVHESRVTYEAGNNVDFRLGTGPLRNTKLAQPGDMMALTRRAHAEYDLKIIKAGSPAFKALDHFLINFIGQRDKRYGSVPNEVFDVAMRDYKAKP